MPYMATPIPFGIYSYERQTALQPEVELVNLFVEKDESGNSDAGTIRIQRPGLTRYANLPSYGRGLYLSENSVDNRIYTVAGDQLYGLDASVNGYTSVGSVANDGLSVAFAPSFDKIVINSGGNVYSYLQNPSDGTSPSFGQLAMPDDRDVIDVTELNNYIILACPDGRFFWIVPGENTVKALSFLTAESSTDGLVAVQRLGDEVYFFGTSSTEVWSATGDALAPFVRSNGRNFTRGLLDRDTVQVMDNTVFWVANNGVVYRASGIPQRVSNHGIEERIRKRTGVLSALTVTVDAHEFYVLKIPGQGSFAYDAASEMWCEFSTLNSTTWRPAYSVSNIDQILLADAESGVIWKFDHNNNTDDGVPMKRLVTGTVRLPSRPARNDSFRLDVGSSGACTYRIRWRDAEEAYPVKTLGMPARAGNDRVTLYRLGLAKGQFRTFEISIQDDVRIRIGDGYANEAVT